MLDPWIIEEIRRRDDERRREREACQIKLPVYDIEPVRRPDRSNEHEEPKRGVVVIDL